MIIFEKQNLYCMSYICLYKAQIERSFLSWGVMIEKNIRRVLTQNIPYISYTRTERRNKEIVSLDIFHKCFIFLSLGISTCTKYTKCNMHPSAMMTIS